jgi:putative peptidoglycan lipid II flippase
VILGAAMQLVVQLPALRQVGYKHVWILGLKRQDVRQAFRLILPRMLGLSLTQLTLIVNTLIASFLMTGSITIFYLADNLQALPLGIIGISFAITSFATLSELATEKSKEPFAQELRRVMGQILFLIIPATMGMLVLRLEIIDVLLAYGKFSSTDAELTAQVLGFLLISLFAQSLIPLLARGFFAFHNTKTPLMAGVIGATVSIVGSLILSLQMEWGIVGIALAYSIGNVVNFLFLYIWMHRQVGCELLDWANTLKMVFLSLIMGFAVFVSKIWLPMDGRGAEQFLWLAGYTLVGLFVYLSLAHFFRLPESEVIWKQVRRMK